jgi:acyl-coenzyme A synthetase/AMP-(fatty) acid ligase
VIPLPDEEAGEVPKAFIVTSALISSNEVIQFVAEHVAPYKAVRAVEILEEIPKSPSGKILRRLLIERQQTAAIGATDAALAAQVEQAGYEQEGQ